FAISGFQLLPLAAPGRNGGLEECSYRAIVKARVHFSRLPCTWGTLRMLFDPPQGAPLAPQAPGKEPVRDKVRIRFRKTGDLRLVSHHDLMLCFERMLRRADLPFHSTQGFHPKPRLVFALSLALGLVGCEEVVELELDAELPTQEIDARLARQAPPGMDILTVHRIARKIRAQVRSATYRLPLPPNPSPQRGEGDQEPRSPLGRGVGGEGSDFLAGLPDRIAAVLASPECWIERTRPQTRRMNIRPYIRDVR